MKKSQRVHRVILFSEDYVETEESYRCNLETRELERGT